MEEPRYASLPNIMKAKKKPMKKLTVADLGLDKDIQPRLETVKVADPPKRQGGAKVCGQYVRANCRSRTSMLLSPSSRRPAVFNDYSTRPLDLHSTVGFRALPRKQRAKTVSGPIFLVMLQNTYVPFAV